MSRVGPGCRGPGLPLAVLALVLLAEPSGAQTPSPGAPLPRLRVEGDTARVTVGDRIHLRVTVDHEVGTRVAWPDSVDLAPFEVLEARVLPPREENGVQRSSLALTLVAFDLGDLEVPSFPVEVVDPQGEAVVLQTNRYGVRVESVGLDDGGDIREIKGPVGLPRSVGGPLLLALAAGLAALLARGIHRRLRGRRSEPGGGGPRPLARPPHEMALEALARLEASPLLERGEVKEYHIQASEILRVYVEGRFGVPALEMTTGDITLGLERVGIEGPDLMGLRRFLDRCDLVKFAKHRPSAEESRGLLSHGRRFVEETSPLPAEEEDSDLGGAGLVVVSAGVDAPEGGAGPTAPGPGDTRSREGET